MSATLKQLLAEQAALEKKISEVRMAEKSDAITKIQALIEENGLTQDDIFAHRTSKAKTQKSKTTVPAKYRDPISGKEWSGRGLAPKWLTGNREDFLIA